MSAYQCSPEHIAFICAIYDTVWNHRKADYMTFILPIDLYAILSTANAESVAFRYREPVAAHQPASKFPRVDIATIDANMGAIFRSIACLEYQSCERDDWKVSPACGFLEMLRDALLSRLPGADRSDAWGLPDLQPVAAAAPPACPEVVATCYPTKGPGISARCAPEIVCNPDEPKRWQLPVWRVAKGREDCRVTGDHALTYALPAPACC